jgi:hypothetical protein
MLDDCRFDLQSIHILFEPFRWFSTQSGMLQ